MIAVERLCPGGLNRVLDQRRDAGGKGVNVALACAALGGRACCVGFLYPQGAEVFTQRLEASGVEYDFVWGEGSARTNLKVFDRSAGVVTEFNQPGRPADAEALAKVQDKVLARAHTGDIAVFSGSMPPGCEADLYARLIARAGENGCRCMLDADGEALRLGIAARPYLIKPNRAELEALCGGAVDSPARAREAAREVIAQGVSVVVVSLGEQGAAIVDRDEAYFAPPLEIKVRSSVGAGDSMVAALALGIERGRDLRALLASAVAAASAMCMTQGSQALSGADYVALLPTVRLERI